MEETKVINQTVRDFSKLSNIIQTILIFLISLLVPTFLGNLIKTLFGAESFITSNTQLIVGSIVNTALITAAINLKGWSKILGIVTMPSVSTILSGYVFKSASPYMAWMIPAIWAGNLALIYSYKYLMLNKKKNYWLASVVGIVIKVAIIALIFMVLKGIGIFPDKLVNNLQKAMTYTQAITASIGAVLAFIIYKTETISKG